uniref:Putative secreted protein n=1 Tax=Ixodes ricinus TaxID=34613 RepID=A0A6B0V8W9_IXORI
MRTSLFSFALAALVILSAGFGGSLFFLGSSRYRAVGGNGAGCLATGGGAVADAGVSTFPSTEVPAGTAIAAPTGTTGEPRVTSATPAGFETGTGTRTVVVEAEAGPPGTPPTGVPPTRVTPPPWLGGPRTRVVPGGRVRVVPPRGRLSGGGARIMRTWDPAGAWTIMVVPGPPGPPGIGVRLPMVMALPGTVVKPPCGEAMRSRIVCMGMGVPEPGAPEMIRGPDSLGVTTIPGGRLGTRYVTLGCAIIDGVRRKLPPACVTTPDDTAVAARSTGWLAEGVT